MVVNRAKSVKVPTLQDWVASNFDFPLAKNEEFRNGVVHRLDKETSGVLVLAKTEEAFKELQRQFKERETGKTYLALAHGDLNTQEGKITAPVGRLPWNREKFGVLAGGREAETSYKVLNRYKKSNGKQEEILTLLELYPKTGRTHQIRVHLKSIHHPIVSDPLYAGRKTARKDRLWCERLFLHAFKLSFKDPETRDRVEVEAPLPEDLNLVLTSLQTV